MSRPGLGVGVIATTGLDLVWDDIAHLIDVVEVEPQTMWHPRDGNGWDVSEPAFKWLESRGRPTLVHGVGFPVGGCEAPDPQGLALTAACAQRLGAPHWSEHLSFNRVRHAGRDLDAGFLLPPAQTAAGIDAAVEHIRGYQSCSERPFLIETGVNYLRPRPGEIPDGVFIAEIAERADCGILLDLHNLLTNQHNGRQTVDEVLAALPLDRVLEIHVAGGVELDGYYLDAHIGGPDLELLTILSHVVGQLPQLRAVVFEAVPSSMVMLGAAGLRAVLEALQRACAGTVESPPFRRVRQPYPHNGFRDTHSLAATRDWERRLAAYTARAAADPPTDDPGMRLLRSLADRARLGQLTLACPDLLRALITTHGMADAEKLLESYLDVSSPQRWAIDEGRQFADWLESAQPGTSMRWVPRTANSRMASSDGEPGSGV
ncbi:DUF692 domain-containing protein [Mycolicibacterium wolinskyi]|uniref:DUF692 domain-containing protein n=1 Tax=Mycolicibacterium wolinskyi TaxID=59750 RepID=UPI0008314C8D|nr:DUF692 family multinuclear iron-containing protein [Mycolicibacterium wolinskyi]